MTYQEEREFLKAIGEKVAPLLGDEWLIDHSWEGPTIMLTGNEDRAIILSLAWNNKQRLVINGSFQNDLVQYLPYYEDREKTEITVKMDSTPERIAKEIKRRLMPPYERILAYAKERKEKDDEYQAEKRRALEMVKEAIGEDASVYMDEEVLAYDPYPINASYSMGEIKLHITLPLEKAIEILKGLSGA
jgi:hypothetical protein